MKRYPHSLKTHAGIIGIAVLIMVSGAYADKDYQISGVHIKARLETDGSLRVTESRTFQFEDNFSYTYRTFPKGSFTGIEQIAVSENGSHYRLEDTRRPGTFRILEDKGSLKIEWYFRADDEARTFDLSFTLHGALTRHPDAALFYYKFIGEDWDKPSHDVWVSLAPPGSLPKSEVNAWLHGPLWGAYRLEDDGSIIAWCEKLPRGKFFEIRALLPADRFPGAPYAAESVREKIMTEEAQLAAEANQARLEARENEERRIARWSLGKWIAGFTGLGGLFGWSALRRKYKQREPLPPPVRISPEVPQNIPPALVDYLLHSKQVSGGGLIGTMLDLARKGILSLHQEEETKPGLFGQSRHKVRYLWKLNRKTWEQKKGTLPEFENSLVDFLFGELAQGADEIDLKTLQKHQSKFMKFFNAWKKTVAESGKEKDWFDRESYRGMGYSMALGGGMMLLTVGAAILFGPWAFITGVSAFLVFILSFAIMQRTREGEILARRWTALRRYLVQYHFRNETSAVLPHLDEYMVYGAVLGIGKKVYHELAGLIPEGRTQHYIPWYVYGGGAHEFSPSAFATAFSAMMATTTSAMSTASGSGGGASGGGGGGAGGGGGGAG